ncbi:rare lipoprotein A [compost metagenome]
MSAKRKFSFGHLAFWVALFGASAGAFGAGFYYTYGATVNVNTKLPGADAIVPKKVPVAAKPTPKASPTAAAGLVALPSDTPASPTPTPKAKPSPSPERIAEMPTPEPFVATPTPAPRRVAPVAAPPQPEIYRVHVGGFADRETAQRQVEELQGAGINAVVVYDQGKYHAQLGAFTDRARALSVADEVNIRGYSVTIRR